MSKISEHLTWRQILDLVDGEMATVTQSSHFDACPDCERHRVEAQNLLGTLQFLAENQPSTEVVSRVVSRLSAHDLTMESAIEWARKEAERQSRSVSDIPAQSWIERVTNRTRQFMEAVLAADSWADQAVAVRGTRTASPRILVYETSEHTISLSFYPGPDPVCLELDLVGTIAPRRGSEIPKEARAFLRTERGEEIETQVRQYGEFRFENLHSQPADLVITLGTDAIEVGSFPEL